ncbi:hypothetical protein [Chromohalobacter sp. 11-W]|uniref:hypothetical protein n=1 Tax=Chromohalobacter sp. 11-W TaxID=2994061 RepID=UPI0024696FD6|nr:hypothetical protein [Chromohalobacter sp. 11-W]
MILGSVGVLGGIATLLVIGIGVAASLVVGLFVSLVTLVFGYWLVTLVAPSVEMWINRSLVGHHQGQIQRFEDMASEQSSLEMVFQGVVVELSWREASHAGPGPSSEREILLKLSVPHVERFELTFSLFCPDGNKELYSHKVIKTENMETPIIERDVADTSFEEEKKEYPVVKSRRDSFFWKWKGVLKNRPCLTKLFWTWFLMICVPAKQEAMMCSRWSLVMIKMFFVALFLFLHLRL